jgi:transcriptional regulator with XRE-family HTH domain
LTGLSTRDTLVSVKRPSLGKQLRALRKQTGLGLKQVAPRLGITYTYLSKLENDAQKPSEELLRRIARYYGEDAAELFVAAGRIPADILAALQSDPQQAVAFLREQLGLKPTS